MRIMLTLKGKLPRSFNLGGELFCAMVLDFSIKESIFFASISSCFLGIISNTLNKLKLYEEL